MTDETDLDDLQHALGVLESQLHVTADKAKQTGIPLLGRLLETWAHTVAMTRANIRGEEPPASLADYLDRD